MILKVSSHQNDWVILSLMNLTFFPHLNAHTPMTAPLHAADPTGDGIPGSSSPEGDLYYQFIPTHYLAEIILCSARERHSVLRLSFFYF